jgi:hypothetical protein
METLMGSGAGLAKVMTVHLPGSPSTKLDFRPRN